MKINAGWALFLLLVLVNLSWLNYIQKLHLKLQLLERENAEAKTLCANSPRPSLLSFSSHSMLNTSAAHKQLLYVKKPSVLIFPPAKERTLVIYAYWDGNSAISKENLLYFLSFAVQEDDNVDYVFVVNLDKERGVFFNVEIPQYSNVRVFTKVNNCFDWGSYELGVRKMKATEKSSPYKRFVFINSSARGPFVSKAATTQLHWTEHLTNLLNDKVKLVGTSINCEVNPHVQSMAFATDKTGLELLLERNIMRCYNDYWDAVRIGEIGASRVILEAGYNIDTLLLHYVSLDFHIEKNKHCNGGRNPYIFDVDGIKMHPLETLFVKHKDNFTDVFAHKYSQWILKNLQLVYKGDVKNKFR